MRFVRTRVLVLFLALLSGLLQTPAQADNIQLTVAEDKTTGYNRSAFKHWIDVDKDGCDTRAEVLIEEAIVKPKIGPKCKLTGGKWISAYDGKTITNSSQLDVDHLVPLAEAWRSGAWKWTAAQRQAYANDLENPEALIAVTATTNRSKSDKDPALWIPQVNKCDYLQNWVLIKSRYSLSVDKNEERMLRMLLSNCEITDIQIGAITPLLSPIVTLSDIPITGSPNTDLANSNFMSVNIFIPKYEGKDSEKINRLDNLETYIWIAYEPFNGSTAGDPAQWCKGSYNEGVKVKTTPANLDCKISKGSEVKFFYYINNCGNCRPAPSDYWAQRSPSVIINTGRSTLPTSSPTPTPTNAELVITPGAFCSPAGAIGKSSSGVIYTCKTSSTDSRNRWRQ